VPENHLFKEEQLVEIYRCCADTLKDTYDLTYEQEQRIKEVQEQIRDIIPDIMERIIAHDQKVLEQESRTHIIT